ncbi:MAG: ketopantoate reductase family protein [Dehalococcoidia bacterium]
MNHAYSRHGNRRARGHFGGLLARAGEDLTFIARGAHLEAIRARGLTVKSRVFGDFTLPVKATDNPAEIGPVDLVLFCVKTYDTDAAAELIRPNVDPDTVVLSVQNGIDNEERVAQAVGSEAVIGATAYVSAVIESPGVIAQQGGMGPGRIVLGELAGGSSPRTERLLDVLRNAGINAELHPDIQVELWQKFVDLCGLGGVGSLTRLPIGPIVSCPETNAFLRETMEEVAAVARARGVALPEECVDKAMDYLASRTPSLRGSMLYDLTAGRRLELETLNGTVVRLGREHDVPTPCNFAIYAALKPYAEGTPAIP